MINRFLLRPVEPGDTDRVHGWARDPRSSVYQSWEPSTEEQTRAFVATAIADWQRDPQERFYFSAADDGLVVGAGELNIVDRRFGRAAMGYIVHPDLWGRGYATKIAAALIRYGFDELDLHRIEGTCDPRNLASAAVLRKAGMRYEGRMRATMKLSDGWRDSELFSVLATDQPVTTA